jgi:centrosomal protein POC5
LLNWRSTAENQWKARFEKACEKKAKDVLIELGHEYELKYKQLELQLLTANEEIARLKVDQGDQDEALKKAFMRGVCALNMEAMSVLMKNSNETETMPFITDENKRIYDQRKSMDNTV